MTRSANSQIATIRHYYAALKRHYGAQNWWPARTRWEVIVGAFLTQNTAWVNVERALANLRGAGKLSVSGMRDCNRRELADLIRPSGYFRQKAKHLKDFIRVLDSECNSSLEKFLACQTPAQLTNLRRRLLAMKGIGPETADSILLYAGDHPSFVVDAYTRRIFTRHGLCSAGAGYDEIRSAVEQALAAGKFARAKQMGLGHRPSAISRQERSSWAQHLNEFHALLVQVGKRHCHKREPDCSGCPLRPFLPAARTSKPPFAPIYQGSASNLVKRKGFAII